MDFASRSREKKNPENEEYDGKRKCGKRARVDAPLLILQGIVAWNKTFQHIFKKNYIIFTIHCYFFQVCIKQIKELRKIYILISY